LPYTNFKEMKEEILEIIKLPQEEYHAQGLFAHLNPFLREIEFQSEKELKKFLDSWTEYHNALAKQYIGNPTFRNHWHSIPYFAASFPLTHKTVLSYTSSTKKAMPYQIFYPLRASSFPSIFDNPCMEGRVEP
jgi:hypothetical protein